MEYYVYGNNSFSFEFLSFQLHTRALLVDFYLLTYLFTNLLEVMASYVHLYTVFKTLWHDSVETTDFYNFTEFYNI